MDGLIHGNISGVLLYSDTKRNTSVLVLYITNDLDTPFLQKLQKIEKSSFINHVFFIFFIQYYYSKWLSSWVCTEQNKLLEQFYGNVSSKRDENSALRLLKCETSHGECECVMVTSCPLGFHLLWEHFGLQEVTNKWSDDFRIIKMHMMTARYSHHSVLRETGRQTG